MANIHMVFGKMSYKEQFPSSYFSHLPFPLSNPFLSPLILFSYISLLNPPVPLNFMPHAPVAVISTSFKYEKTPLLPTGAYGMDYHHFFNFLFTYLFSIKFFISSLFLVFNVFVSIYSYNLMVTTASMCRTSTLQSRGPPHTTSACAPPPPFSTLFPFL